MPIVHSSTSIFATWQNAWERKRKNTFLYQLFFQRQSYFMKNQFVKYFFIKLKLQLVIKSSNIIIYVARFSSLDCLIFSTNWMPSVLLSQIQLPLAASCLPTFLLRNWKKLANPVRRGERNDCVKLRSYQRPQKRNWLQLEAEEKSH